MERLDTVWDALAFDAPWKSQQEKTEARAALERFLNWHVLERGRDLVATEHGFDVTLDVGGVSVRIRGSMDRVEKDTAGRAYVVDFKTGKQIPTDKSLPEHKQLAVYQLAVRAGALNELPGFADRPRPPAAPNSSTCASPPPRPPRTPPRCSGRTRRRASRGSRTCSPPRRQGPRRALRPADRRRLRPLRLPPQLLRPAGRGATRRVKVVRRSG